MYKKLFTALLIVSCLTASAQLHHQMLSSQGNTSISQKGVVVTQTIGQQSVVGNYSSLGFTFGQGFQQANWARIIIEQSNSQFEVSVYPNPFVDNLYIQHNSNDDINVTIFDPAGKLVYNHLLKFSVSTQPLNLEILPSGLYLIRLQSKQLNYFTKLIKK